MSADSNSTQNGHFFSYVRKRRSHNAKDVLFDAMKLLFTIIQSLIAVLNNDESPLPGEPTNDVITNATSSVPGPSLKSLFPSASPTLSTTSPSSSSSATSSSSPTSLYDFPIEANDTSWNFLVMADPHFAERFAVEPGLSSNAYKIYHQTLSYIHETYAGDLVLIPGDTTGGRWDTDGYRDKHYPGMDKEKIVQTAATNCFSTIRTLFENVGWNKLFVAIGDHEIGDNDWLPGSDKVNLLPTFRKAFVDALYRDYDTGYFMYSKKIGNSASTPWRTDFQFTSFAHVHKNVLFITVDEFKLKGQHDYFDRARGIGGNGVVTGDVIGAHLNWFIRVLKAGRNDSNIKHIIVQGHLPILHAVRKVRSSSMFFDFYENSAFWKAMVDYNVDLYFAGEVHSFTADKELAYDLVQIVSSSSKFNAFLNVQVSDVGLRIISHTKKESSDMEYSETGVVIIDKREASHTTVSSSGILEIRDHQLPILHYDFEALSTIEDRPVWLMKEKGSDDDSAESFNVGGVEVRESLPNNGSFGQFYDAQIGDLTLVEGIHGASAGLFNSQSVMATFAMGPQAGGQVISVAMWIKTSVKKELILFHYDHKFNGNSRDNNFSMTLAYGQPKLYSSSTSVLQPAIPINLNDGRWHHIAVTMIRRSCLLSEVLMYIDGKSVRTQAINDDYLYVSSYGSLSIGGLGYSNTKETEFPSWRPYEGVIDEIYVWDRRIWPRNDLATAMKKNFKASHGRECKQQDGSISIYYIKNTDECSYQCSLNRLCWGYEIQFNSHTESVCKLFTGGERPLVGDNNSVSSCFSAV